MIKSRVRGFGADFSLLLVAISWGGTFFIVQEALKETPVYIFLFWRFMIAAVLMAIFSLKEFRKLDFDTLKAGTVLGLFMFVGYATQTFALTYIYSSTVAFITGLYVVIVPIALFLIFAKRVSLYSLFGICCAAVGLYLMQDGGELGGFGRGEFYAFICAVMFALHIVYTDLYVKKYSAFLLVTIQFTVVGLLCFVGALVIDGGIMPARFDAVFLQGIVITVIFATIFAFFVQTVMQKFTTPAKTAIIFTFEPVSAGIIGYYFAGEEFYVVQILGIGLILFGMLSAEVGTYLRSRKIRSV